MQGYHGDNTIVEPPVSDPASHVLWQGWTDQKGIEKHQAKILFLESVAGLW